MLGAHVPVPIQLQHERFVATPLTREVAELDYASYMASPQVISVHSDGRWPVEDFQLADDLELVAKHQADHQNRRAFTFVLLDPTRAEALGCLYLNPLRDYLRRVRADAEFVDALPTASAMITFWLRQDQQETGLADVVAEAVNDWLRTDWPLRLHLFRILPNERSSRAALDRLNLKRIELTLPGEKRPYLWYRPR